MGSTQITLGEIEMKEGWVKGERLTDGKREKREGRAKRSSRKKQGSNGGEREESYLNLSLK